MAAAARSEARRRAILARGNDRLAKLTASARGEDATTYVYDDQRDLNSSPDLSAFIGQESKTHVPSRPVPPSAPILDSSPWSEDQQMQFLETLMGAHTSSVRPRTSRSADVGNDSSTRADPDSLTSSLSKTQIALPVDGLVNESADAASMRWRALLPLIQLITIWVLVAYFVLFDEPKAFRTHDAGGQWRRWTTLSGVNAKAIDFLEIRVVPFFWVFISLQVTMHTVRIVYKYDEISQTGLFAVAMSNLPPAISTILLHGLKYVQMGEVFLDGMAGVIVGLGLVVWVSNLLTNSD